MSDRYRSWYHKRFSPDTPSWLRKIGEVVLGRVAQRQQQSGLGTVQETVRLDDGSVVRATMIGEQPILELLWSDPSGGTDACQLYMESGVVDLGEDRGAAGGTAIHDPSPKMLHFGDLVDCQVMGGLNGEVRYTSATLSSDCVAGSEDGTRAARCLEQVRVSDTSIISRQMKIDAHANLPASMFTGLARKYVQAHYGCPASAYHRVVNRFRLRLYRPDDGTTFDMPAHIAEDGAGYSIGLAHVDGRYYFLRLELRQPSRIYPARFTRCGEVLARVLRSGIAGERGDKRFDRLEAYLFTQMFPAGDEEASSFPLPEIIGAPLAYGWKFSRDGSRASIVCKNATSGAWSAHECSLTRAESGELLLQSAMVERVPDNLAGWPDDSGYQAAPSRGVGYGSFPRADVPVYSWFDAEDRLRIVRSVRTYNPVPLTEGWASSVTGCAQAGSGNAATWAYLDGYEGRTGLAKCASWRTVRTPDSSYYRTASFYVDGLWSESLVPGGEQYHAQGYEATEAGTFEAVQPQNESPRVIVQGQAVPEVPNRGVVSGCGSYISWVPEMSGWQTGSSTAVQDYARAELRSFEISRNTGSIGNLQLIIPPNCADAVLVYATRKQNEGVAVGGPVLATRLVRVTYNATGAVAEYSMMLAVSIATAIDFRIPTTAGFGFAANGSDALRAFGATEALQHGRTVFDGDDEFAQPGYPTSTRLSCGDSPSYQGNHAPGPVKYGQAGDSKAEYAVYMAGAYYPRSGPTRGARVRPPVLQSYGGHAWVFDDPTFNLEVMNKPMSNTADVSADVRNPSIVGWA